MVWSVERSRDGIAKPMLAEIKLLKDTLLRIQIMVFESTNKRVRFVLSASILFSIYNSKSSFHMLEMDVYQKSTSQESYGLD